MAFERRDYAGGAVPTTITAPVTALSTSWDIADPTGWPQGTNGPFDAVFNRKYGTSNLDGSSPEEKVLVASLVGTTITLADSSSRGIDGTSPQAWAAPATFEHCLTARDLDEANLAVSQTVGQVQQKGDVLSGKSANRFQRTAIGSDGALWVCDASAPGGFRFSSLPDGAINSAAQIADNLIPPQKLAGLVMTAAQIDALTGDDLFIGHQVYQEDTTAARPAQGLYIYNGVAWSKPWNVPWGRIGFASSTAPQNGNGSSATLIAGLTLSPTLVANRQMLATVRATYTQGSGGTASLFVNDGATIRTVFSITNGAGETGRGSGGYDWVSTAGTPTITGMVAGAGGQVDIFASSTNRSVLTLDDLGPAGDPA